MKASSISVVVSLALVFGATLINAAQADPGTAAPTGSYLKSCTEVDYSNITKMLTATCTEISHGQEYVMGKKSSLDTSFCHKGTIANDDGLLECIADMNKANGMAIPKGSYRQSCGSKSVLNHTLHATCDDGSGHHRAVTLRLVQCNPHGDISNTFGQLICAPRS